ncbi:MAG: hypothetical protein SPL08_05855, partial [Pseudomonadota bacterium]|nr:hypothetical protein [Pseudomonadota bacterium]
MKQEQGRSMVEMLGVLAVTGVLTIGAMAGYTYAMNKHRSNELIDEANKRAVMVLSQIDTLGVNATPNLGEFTDNAFGGGTFTGAVQIWDGEFGIQVNGVSQGVCKQLIQMMTDNVSIAKVAENDTEPENDLIADDCEDTNNLYIVFSRGESAGVTETPETPETPKHRCDNDDIAAGICASDDYGRYCKYGQLSTEKCATEPVCIGTGTCECIRGNCRCANGSQGTYPYCVSINKCITGAGGIYWFDDENCHCFYGTFPNCLNNQEEYEQKRQACLNAGTCECEDVDNYMGCQCKYGGSYPANCWTQEESEQKEQACLNAGTCACASEDEPPGCWCK